jgi:uncharacterized coiled-coil DUF342 family protein
VTAAGGYPTGAGAPDDDALIERLAATVSWEGDANAGLVALTHEAADRLAAVRAERDDRVKQWQYQAERADRAERERDALRQVLGGLRADFDRIYDIAAQHAHMAAGNVQSSASTEEALT